MWSKRVAWDPECITLHWHSPIRNWQILFYWMFYDHFLRTHSWLNWVDEDDDEDEVGLKEKPDTSKRLHRNKTWITGSVDKGLNLLDPNLLPSSGLRTQTSACASSLRVPTGVYNVSAGGRLQLGRKLWFPRPKEEVFKVFCNLHWWTAFCMPWYNFLIMAHNTWGP